MMNLVFLPLVTGFGYYEDAAVFVDLLGNSTYPEGILVVNDEILVGGFGDGSLQYLNGGYFNEPGANGMVIAVGFDVDEYLWVANFDFAAGSQMKVFDLNGTLVASIPEQLMPGVFLNEVVITGGVVYVSDTFSSRIFNATLDGIGVFVDDPLLTNPERPFGQNGLTVTPNEQYLMASVMDRLDAGDGRLVRVDLTTRQVVDVALTGNENFAGSDGMFFYDDMLFMVNVFSAAGAIYTATFNSDFSVATLVMRDAFQDVYDRPTASAIFNNRLYTVNSQLDHIVDDANGALGTDPDVPFQVVHVPLSTLLS